MSAIPDKDSGLEESTDRRGGIADETTLKSNVASVVTASPAEDAPEPTAEEVCTALAQLERLEPAFAGDTSELRKEEFEASIQFATERLAASSDAEHRHVAAILESNPAKRIEYLKSAVLKSGNNAFLLWDAVRICSSLTGETSCPLPDWEARLLAVDGQNSEVWVRIAANRLRAGDEDGALQAMQRAAVSPESRAYWPESVEAVERALSAAGNFTFPERVAVAFGSRNLPRYSDYTSMCRTQPAGNPQWAYACLAYGESLERQGKTEIGQSIGLALQEMALEFLGEQEKLAAVLDRQEENRAERRPLDTVGTFTDALVFTNPAVFSDYLAELRKLDESSAREYLRAEAQRWLSAHGAPGCVP